MQTSTNSSSSCCSTTSEPKGSRSIGPDQDQGQEHRKSSFVKAIGKAKAKMSRSPSGAEELPDDEGDFERQKAKEVEKQKRKDDYERLGLGDRTKYGVSGAGGWKSV